MVSIVLAFSFYGRGDATGGASFFDLIFSGSGMKLKMFYPIGLLRSGKHYMLSNPLISVLAKIIDPLSRLPVIRDIFVNDIFVLLTK